VPTFAGGVIAAAATNDGAPPRGGECDRDGRAAVTVASCEVVLRLPHRMARRWRAGVVSADLQPADVLAILLRRQQETPTDLSDPHPPGPSAAMTVTMPEETLADLDRLRDSTRAASRSALCAALLAGQLDDQ
jgi:hypothetical protein